MKEKKSFWPVLTEKLFEIWTKSSVLVFKVLFIVYLVIRSLELWTHVLNIDIKPLIHFEQISSYTCDCGANDHGD